MGWEDKVKNDYEELTHSKLMMFDDFVKHCELYNKNISVNSLLKQGFNKLEINWLGLNRRLDIKRVNERFYLHKIRELESELKSYKDSDIKPFTGIDKPKYKVVRLENEFIVKDNYNYSKQRYSKSHYIRKLAVRNLWSTLKFLADDDNNIVDYRSIARGLIIRYNLSIDADSFNGGHNRGKYLFPYYYYPLKILEHYGYVRHYKNGTVLVKKLGEELPDHLGGY